MVVLGNVESLNDELMRAAMGGEAGELVVAEGEVADDGMLAGMMFYVQGIDGDIPQ